MKALDCNLQWASDNWQGTFAQRAMGFWQLARYLCTTCNGLPTIGKVPLHNVQCASDNWQGAVAQRAMRFRQLARCRCTACKTDLTIVKVPLHNVQNRPDNWIGGIAHLFSYPSAMPNSTVTALPQSFKNVILFMQFFHGHDDAHKPHRYDGRRCPTLRYARIG